MKPIMQPPTFVEFCQERLRVSLTPGQEILAAICFDGEDIPPEAARLFGGFHGHVSREALKTIVWLCGRSSGKTRLAAYYILWRMLYADLSRLAPGEIGFGVVFSPNKDLSGQMLRFALGVLKGTRFERAIRNVTKESFDVRRPDGQLVRFAVLAAAKKGITGRGRSLVAAALDECCFFSPETAGAVNDQDVFEALPARLMPGGSIVLCSTPWQQSGLLFDLWQSELGKPKTALVAVAPTELMRPDNPDLLGTIASLRERDPDNYAREYCCEWIATGSGEAFDRESLQRSRVESLPDAQPLEVIHVGGDIGLSNDPSAFVAARLANGVIEVVDVLQLKARKGEPLNLARVLDEASAFTERNHATRKVRVDGHVFEPARQAAEAAALGISLERCNDGIAAREERFANLADLFNAGRVRVPLKFAGLLDQLALIAKVPRNGGGYTFLIPRRDGHHCDAAMALLLAVESIWLGRMPSEEQLAEAAPNLIVRDEDDDANFFDRVAHELESRVDLEERVSRGYDEFRAIQFAAVVDDDPDDDDRPRSALENMRLIGQDRIRYGGGEK